MGDSHVPGSTSPDARAEDDFGDLQNVRLMQMSHEALEAIGGQSAVDAARWGSVPYVHAWCVDCMSVQHGPACLWACHGAKSCCRRKHTALK